METLESLFERLDRLNDVGASLSAERDLDRLLKSGAAPRAVLSQGSARFARLHNKSI